MGAPTSVSLPKIVTPGETIDISIALTAPDSPGAYKGIWSFEDMNGRRFGLGINSSGEIWVQVQVIAGPTSTSTQTLEPTPISTSTPAPPFIKETEIQAYDLVAEACSAQWTSDGVAVPCPGSGLEAQTAITQPVLEDGSEPGFRSIRINPGAANRTVSGMYAEYLVQPGDQFRAIASCEENASPCSVLFRLSYQDAAGLTTDLWAVGEFYDQKYTELNIDLSALAGQNVRFILNVTALNNDPQNDAFWVSPGIYRIPLPTATPTLTATATGTTTGTPTQTRLPTLVPTATATAVPQEKEPQSMWEAIQQFFDDLFKRLFGG